MMPILPFIEDNVENISRIVSKGVQCGATYVIPWFGMSMRDRQRAYYYAKLDELFPGLRRRYERRYGNQYHCEAEDAQQLREVFGDLVSKYSLETRVVPYEPEPKATQLSLL